MCGVVGFVATKNGSATEQRHIASVMADQVRHRGPDDYGFWSDEAKGIVLAHRRLAILDLSRTGHQPMHSSTGRYVLAFNGEIYNHLALREELEALGSAPVWNGRSDTESLLAGFDTWGIRETVKRTIGMFALAVWDRQECSLTLARDRLGEKPVYYGWQGSTFLFGSELKALRAHPAFEGEIDRGALCLLLRHNCIPAPYSIYRGISKLPPGTLLTLSVPGLAERLERFWSLSEVLGKVPKSPLSSIDAAEAARMLERLLREAIGQQMVADVPLGAFLSGGIDSSTVVALMQAQSSRPIKTFSIGFKEDGYNEAEYAMAVAGHLGTDHTELYVTPAEALTVIPRLPSLFCEPFSDSSQIPTFLVAHLARQHVTVSLSGDGGDELFCGYNRYTLAARAWKFLSPMPRTARNTIAFGLSAISPSAWDRLMSPIVGALPAQKRLTNVGEKLHKAASVMGSPSSSSLYRALVSHWDNPASVVIGGEEYSTVVTDPAQHPPTNSFAEWMMALDLLTYLPDDILVKVDRAAMAVSLETRVPFLDHRVVEFAWRLPITYKLRGGQGKWLLRQVLYKYIPKELIERQKSGFSMPIGSWLRGPLKDWCESLIDERRLTREGYFNPEPIRRKWTEHLSGRRNWQHQLWDVLMFQAWHDSLSAAAPRPTSQPPVGTFSTIS
jgi:asparagine synthase (glutamine-hydrolysing)